MIYRRFWLHTFLVADGDKGISTRIAADRNWRVIILFLDAAVPLEYGNLMTKTVSWDTLVSIYLSGGSLPHFVALLARRSAQPDSNAAVQQRGYSG